MTHYEQFDVPPGAQFTSIRDSYLALAKQLHPDVAGNTAEEAERFKAVAYAYAVLRDPVTRQRYDEQLALRGLICKICKGTGQTESAVSFTAVARYPCAACKGTGLVKINRK